VVHHDHPLGREQGAVDQTVLSRSDEIVGEQALETGECPAPGHLEDRWLVYDHDGPVSEPLEASAINLGQRHQ
jgi:hypothetical protein